jgi:hypothetical protein
MKDVPDDISFIFSIFEGLRRSSSKILQIFLVMTCITLVLALMPLISGQLYSKVCAGSGEAFMIISLFEFQVSVNCYAAF